MQASACQIFIDKTILRKVKSKMKTIFCKTEYKMYKQILKFFIFPQGGM